MMYRDAVPDAVNGRIAQGLKRRLGLPREGLMTIAACNLIGHFISPKRADDYWSLLLEQSNGGAWVGISRIIEMGNFIFFALSQPDAEEWFRRLGRVDFAKSFQEATAANFFFRHGYRVHVREEVQRRGEDFDFSVQKSGSLINVEVTELSGSAFTPNNIKNALHSKRNQLPADAANVFFCILPWRWADTAEEWFGSAVDAAQAFLRGTGRIGAVLFAFENYSGIADSEKVPLRWQMVTPLINARARHPLRAELFLGARSLRRSLPFDFVYGSVGRRRSDFLKWFDRLLLFDERRLTIEPGHLWADHVIKW